MIEDISLQTFENPGVVTESCRYWAQGFQKVDRTFEQERHGRFGAAGGRVADEMFQAFGSVHG